MIRIDSQVDISDIEISKPKNVKANSDFQLTRGNAEMWKLFMQTLALSNQNIMWFILLKKSLASSGI